MKNTDLLANKLATPTVMTVSSKVRPKRIIEVELGQPLPSISALDEETEHHYQCALCLVRLHNQPLGLIELQLDEGEISAEQLAGRIWQTFSIQINEHLRQDHLSPLAQLDIIGLPDTGRPHCIEERERFLVHAPFASIIVPTRDQPERIRGCLLSLLSLDYPNYEIIIVDNAPSTSATADFVQQNYADVPQIRYVREEHPGISWARNRGIEVAKGEILAFTDDDVKVDRYWLVELVRAFNCADNVKCVTGLILPLELETPAQFWFEEYGGFNKGFTRRIFDMKGFRPKTPLYPYTAGTFGTGASMAFLATFLRSTNGFDPTLGAGSLAKSGEDFAMFFQVIKQGHKLVYEPSSLVHHLHRRSYEELRKQIYNYAVGLVAYLMKITLDNPRLLFDLLTRVPYGFFFILSSKSPKHGQKSASYPKELATTELKGMLHGPVAYMRSRWKVRHTRKGLISIGKGLP